MVLFGRSLKPSCVAKCLVLPRTVKRKIFPNLKELCDNITQLDAQYATSPTPELYQKRICLQTEFDQASTAKDEHLLLRARHTVYEFGDKVSRLFCSPGTTVICVASNNSYADHLRFHDY